MGTTVPISRDVTRRMEIDDAFDDAQHMLDGCIPLIPREAQVEAMEPNFAEALWALKQLERKTRDKTATEKRRRSDKRRAKAPVIVERECAVCNKPMAVVVGAKKGGRPRKYCSDACRQKLARIRAARAAKEERNGPAAAATGDSSGYDRNKTR